MTRSDIRIAEGDSVLALIGSDGRTEVNKKYITESHWLSYTASVRGDTFLVRHMACCSDSELLRLDAATGESKWKSVIHSGEMNAVAETGTTFHFVHIEPQPHMRRCLVIGANTQAAYVECFDIESGACLWRTSNSYCD